MPTIEAALDGKENREKRQEIIEAAAVEHHGVFPVILLLGMAAFESEGTFDNKVKAHGVMGVTEYASCYTQPYVNTESSLRENVACAAFHLNGYAWTRSESTSADSKEVNEAIKNEVLGDGFNDDTTWRIVAAVQWYAGSDKKGYLYTLANIIEGSVEAERSIPGNFGYQDPDLVRALRAGYRGRMSLT